MNGPAPRLSLYPVFVIGHLTVKECVCTSHRPLPHTPPLVPESCQKMRFWAVQKELIHRPYVLNMC